MLLLPLTIANYLHLEYRSDLAILVVRWRRAVSFGELQAGFQIAREVAYRYEATRWLVDVRLRSGFDNASSGWVATTLLPAVAAEVAPRSLHVAYVLSAERAEQVRLDPTLRSTAAIVQASPIYQFRLFQDEAEAMNWLLT